MNGFSTPLNLQDAPKSYFQNVYNSSTEDRRVRGVKILKNIKTQKSNCLLNNVWGKKSKYYDIITIDKKRKSFIVWQDF